MMEDVTVFPEREILGGKTGVGEKEFISTRDTVESEKSVGQPSGVVLWEREARSAGAREKVLGYPRSLGSYQDGLVLKR